MTLFDTAQSLLPSKLLLLVRVIAFFIFSTLIMGCAGNTGNIQSTQKTDLSSSPADQKGIQPLPLDGSSFYYYADGEKIELTPSLKWVSVKFVSGGIQEHSDALQDSIVDPLGQARQIPMPVLTLLPLHEGLTTETLIQGINSLRADRSNFLLVNPVFQTADAQIVVTDEFIASFPAEKGEKEINAINSSYGVEIVEPILGQANTFILRITDQANLDALSMSNFYQEANVAIYAAPNFIRITKN